MEKTKAIIFIYPYWPCLWGSQHIKSVSTNDLYWRLKLIYSALIDPVFFCSNGFLGPCLGREQRSTNRFRSMVRVVLGRAEWSSWKSSRDRTKLLNGSEFVRWAGIMIHISFGQVLGLKSGSEIQWPSSKTLTLSFHGPIHGPDLKETVREIPWLKSEYHFQYN